MYINIDTNKIIRKLENFWNHIHFHPTDAIEDHWGKAILDQIAQDNVAKYVRIYSMFEDMVSRNESGELEYDFSLNDSRIDYMIEKGFKLLICCNFMPKAIAKDPNLMSEAKRYKGKKLYFSKPADYNDWQEVVYNYVKHLVERYGMEEVSSWYFHCWNEPDHCYWLSDASFYDEVEQERKLQEYLKLYDHFAAAIMRVSEQIKFGGPSIAAGPDSIFFEAFIKHTREGVNHVTGKIGTRIDFVSLHTYSIHPVRFQYGLYPSVQSMLDKTYAYYNIMKKYAYEDLEIIIDEWDASCCGFKNKYDYPELDYYRNSEYHAAFYAKMVHDYIKELYEKRIPVSKMMICLSGQHDLTEDFMGYRNFFTLNHFPKAIYNGYVLMAKLADLLIAYELEDPDKNIGIIPTADESGNYKILIYYMHEDINENLPNKKIRIKITGLQADYKVTHYRIDHNTSNSYRKWIELGQPKNPDQMERESIRVAGQLSAYYPSYCIHNASEYVEDIVMTQNAISMIELQKIN